MTPLPTPLRTTLTCARHAARVLLVLTSAGILATSALLSCKDPGDVPLAPGASPPVSVADRSAAP